MTGWVVMGLVVCAGSAYAAPSSLVVQGSVAAVHKVAINNTGATNPALGTQANTGAKIGELVVNNNNATGFAVRFFSRNYANGYKDVNDTSGKAVLLLVGATVASADVRTDTNKGMSIPYTFVVAEKSAQPNTFERGIDISNIKISTTALTTALSSAPSMALKNATDASNEVRFLSPTQATVDHTFEVGITTATKASLYSGNFADTIEVAILDFDANAADTATLYDASGVSTTF